jgi:tetratricopeptide (TPR) repeat protein
MAASNRSRVRAEKWFNTGLKEQEKGCFREALACYGEALENDPSHGPTLFHVGVALHRTGDLAGAEQSFLRALAVLPNSSEAWLNLGLVRGLRGDMACGIKALRRCLEVDGGNRIAWEALGQMLRAISDLPASINALRHAVSCESPSRSSVLSLAGVLLESKELDEAANVLERAERLFGLDSAVSLMRAQLLEGQQRIPEALEVLARVPIEGDEAVEAELQRSRLLLKTGRRREGLARLESFARIWPERRAAHAILSAELLRCSRPFDALPHLEWQLEHEPSPALRIVHATVLPVIPASDGEIEFFRDRMRQELLRCQQETFTRQGALPSSFSTTNFYLAYHDRSDISLQRLTESVYRKACPALSFVAPHCKKAGYRPAGSRIKIAFLSEYLRHHTIGKLNSGYIANLDRRRFEVFDIFLGDTADGSARGIGALADRYLPLGGLPLPELQATIGSLGLDIAFFTDIGMGQSSFRLAFSRLAPVQCVTWGHPDTTGITTLDYFLSSEVLEPPGAEADYTEQLVRLQRVNSYYRPPLATSPTKVRSEYGIADGWNVYAIPQSLFKLHPDFDAVLGRILEGDPQAHIVLIADPHGILMTPLELRFARTLGDLKDRVHFLPRLNAKGFFGLAGVADVVLDVPQFSGGNTSYEAFSVGAPIVTRRSNFMRGRLTAALYQMMGLGDLVCRDDREYVETAVRLGTNPELRQEWRTRILQSCQQLYCDQVALRELEDFLEQAVESRQRTY